MNFGSLPGPGMLKGPRDHHIQTLGDGLPAEFFALQFRDAVGVRSVPAAQSRPRAGAREQPVRNTCELLMTSTRGRGWRDRASSNTERCHPH